MQQVIKLLRCFVWFELESRLDATCRSSSSSDVSQWESVWLTVFDFSPISHPAGRPCIDKTKTHRQGRNLLKEKKICLCADTGPNESPHADCVPAALQEVNGPADHITIIAQTSGLSGLSGLWVWKPSDLRNDADWAPKQLKGTMTPWVADYRQKSHDVSDEHKQSYPTEKS